MKKYHFVYQIENLINEKIYIGKHSTDDLDDYYMGSGPRLLESIKKHGSKNFRKTILKFFDTPEEALEYESEIVTEEFVSNRNTYNIVIGGKGGFPWHLPEFREKKEKFAYDNAIKMHLEGKWHSYDWTGRKHRLETREKMSQTRLERGTAKGEKNSQYGTMWIISPDKTDSIRIPKDDLEQWLTKGWTKGRKMKSGICFGEKNHGYQKIWVTSREGKSLRVSEKELEQKLLEGWKRGRNI
jgi:hypothetical protein